MLTVDTEKERLREAREQEQMSSNWAQMLYKEDKGGKQT